MKGGAHGALLGAAARERQEMQDMARYVDIDQHAALAARVARLEIRESPTQSEFESLKARVEALERAMGLLAKGGATVWDGAQWVSIAEVLERQGSSRTDTVTSGDRAAAPSGPAEPHVSPAPPEDEALVEEIVAIIRQRHIGIYAHTTATEVLTLLRQRGWRPV